MIEFRDVTVEANGTLLLDHVSLRIASGEKVLLIGESGSGKSSILLSLLGKHAPSGGQILYNNEVVTASSVQGIRNDVAYIGQEPALGTGTVIDAIEMPFCYRANRHRRPSREKIESQLDQVGLAPAILKKNVADISGGEKQRIAVARALLLGKRVFLADEITSALDETNAEIITRLFADSDWTVLAVSHYPLFRELFPRKYLVSGGKVIPQE